MKRLTEKKYARFLVFMCSVIYFVSYVTRINYAAVLIEIINDMQVTKAAASLALTGTAISYGAGQIISGYLGDKMRPSRIITGGLICTSLMNIIIPFCGSTVMMTVVWVINGFAQAMMWPPMVKILSSMLDEDSYKKGCMKVSWGSSFATVFIYIIAPVIIRFLSWRYIFVFSAALGVIMAIIWSIVYGKIESHTHEVEAEMVESMISDEKYERFTPKVIGLLAIVLFTIILQGSLRDGVINWMPAYVSEPATCVL